MSAIENAVGTVGTAACKVNNGNTAVAMGSGDMPVFATPALAALMEAAASGSVLPFLEAGETTVGTLIEVQHTSATPLGMEVRAESRLEKTDGRRLFFSLKAWDEAGPIGEGKHERFIVFKEKFIQKSEGKKGHSHG